MIWKRALRAAAFQAVSAALFGVFYILISQRQEVPIFPFLLLLFAPSAGLLDVLFLSGERSTRSIFIFNGILTAAFSVTVFLSCTDMDVLIRLMALPVSIFYCAYSVKIAADDVSYRTFLRMLDFGIVVFLVVAVCTQTRGYPEEMTYMSAVAISVSLFAVLLMRHDGTGGRGWVSTIVLIAALVALVFLLAGYASAAGGSIMALWNLVQRFFYLVYDFFNWLFSLLPKVDAAPDDNLIPLVTDDPYRKGEVVREALPDKILELALLIVLTAAGLVLLVYWIRRMRRMRHVPAGKKRRVFAASAATGVRMAFASLCRMLRTGLYIFRNRGNSVGLYFWLRSALRKDELGKRRAETPREFLTRLDEAVPGCAVASLADDIELVFYSGVKNVPDDVPNAAAVRMRIRRVRACRRAMAFLMALKNRFRRR